MHRKIECLIENNLTEVFNNTMLTLFTELTPFIGIPDLFYQTLGIILLSTLEVAKVSKYGMACLRLNKGGVNYSADSRTNTACL